MSKTKKSDGTRIATGIRGAMTGLGGSLGSPSETSATELPNKTGSGENVGGKKRAMKVTKKSKKGGDEKLKMIDGLYNTIQMLDQDLAVLQARNAQLEGRLNDLNLELRSINIDLSAKEETAKRLKKEILQLGRALRLTRLAHSDIVITMCVQE